MARAAKQASASQNKAAEKAVAEQDKQVCVSVCLFVWVWLLLMLMDVPSGVLCFELTIKHPLVHTLTHHSSKMEDSRDRESISSSSSSRRQEGVASQQRGVQEGASAEVTMLLVLCFRVGEGRQLQGRSQCSVQSLGRARQRVSVRAYVHLCFKIVEIRRAFRLKSSW